jgi:hypothetical protein
MTIRTKGGAAYSIDYRDLDGTGPRLAVWRHGGPDDPPETNKPMDADRGYRVSLLTPLPPEIATQVAMVLDPPGTTPTRSSATPPWSSPSPESFRPQSVIASHSPTMRSCPCHSPLRHTPASLARKARHRDTRATLPAAPIEVTEGVWWETRPTWSTTRRTVSRQPVAYGLLVIRRSERRRGCLFGA